MDDGAGRKLLSLDGKFLAELRSLESPVAAASLNPERRAKEADAVLG